MLTPGASSALYLNEITELVWPRFIELNGLVIRDQPGVRDSFDQWQKRHGEESWRIESVMNHVHLYDFVGDDYTDTELPTLERTALRIQASWRVALIHEFPDRTFEVTYATEPDEYGPTVSFHQPPPSDSQRFSAAAARSLPRARTPSRSGPASRRSSSRATGR
jgi:hypothetical protein